MPPARQSNIQKALYPDWHLPSPIYGDGIHGRLQGPGVLKDVINPPFPK